jgi:hypothetical protein
VSDANQRTTPPWGLVFLAAIAVVLVTILSSATASAATTTGAENRVRARGVSVEPFVGTPPHITAGQRLGEAAPGPETTVATGVAAKACSFTGATVVLMAEGTKKPIEDIKVGDKVLATDPATGEQVAKTVEHVWVHDDTVVDLVVDGEVIATTEDHPFWSVTDQRFERADALAGGELVLGAEGDVVAVSGLNIRTQRQSLAYNLTVEGIHTYHVGQSEILVHNTCNVPLPSQVAGKTTPLATSQAADLAKYLGYSRTNYLVKGERVFQRVGSYIVQDTTAHSGGVWKIANSVKGLGSKDTRTATTDALLNVIGR